jgi:CRP-like cAMP-binding protein
MVAATATATALHGLLAANFPGLPLDAPPATAALSAALPHCRLVRLRAGETLFAQGSAARALYGVVSGEMVMRFGSADGAETTIELAGPVRLFGLAAFAGGRPSSYEAVARGACSVLAIGQGGYEQLMDGLPGFGRALMREFARRHDGTLRMLQASRLQPAAERLWLAIEQLCAAGRASPPQADGTRVLRASQAQLAALAGLSRQTVNETLRRLAAQGVLETTYGGLRLRTARR